MDLRPADSQQVLPLHQQLFLEVNCGPTRREESKESENTVQVSLFYMGERAHLPKVFWPHSCGCCF